MTDLLIEVWEDGNGQEMGPVLEFNDLRRSPDSRMVHSFRARSFSEARQVYDLWCGINSIDPKEQDNDKFTDEMRVTQDEYLARRDS